MAEVQRRLAAILAADVVGFSAMMERAEEATYAEINRLRREVIDPNLARHQGRLIKSTGDGVFAEFASPLAAAKCAIDIQRILSASSDGIRMRMGLNLGDVIVQEDGDVYGEGINVAARLEGLADPGGILVSAKVHNEIEGKLDAEFEDRGERQLKNIAKPIRTYAVTPSGSGRPNSASSKVMQGPAQPALPDKPSIAVLPFQNMSGDVEQEYFADGMVEDIITALSRSKSLFVIARNSSFTYKGKAIDIKQVGRELGVRYVLEGSVRKVGNRVRITGQLIDAATGAHLWADRFDSQLEDIFDLQDRVSVSVLGAIVPHLERAEMERAQRKPTESLQAYDYYLRALSSTHRYTREANLEALNLAHTAAKLDPEFALAYALGALCINQKKAFAWIADADREVQEARRLARRAVELDKDDPMVLAMAGQTVSFVVGEVEAGAALLARAIGLDPNLAPARYWYGFTLTSLGEVDLAIDQFNAALRLSPLEPRIFLAHSGMAYAHFLADRYEEGSLCAKIAAQQQPNYILAHRAAMACHAMAGRVEEARQVCAVALQLDPTQRISDIKRQIPYVRKTDIEKLVMAFRIAGMPE
jgi:adenylate cyclase